MCALEYRPADAIANHEFLSGTSRLLAYLKITGRNGRDGRNPSQNITTHYPVYPILLEFFHYYYFPTYLIANLLSAFVTNWPQAVAGKSRHFMETAM